MSSVFVHVGQCGNQIGEQFWNIVSNDPTSLQSTAYNHGGSQLHRSVHIDSEPKVLQRLMKEDTARDFRGSNIIHSKKGRGNNWAMGYGIGNIGNQELVNTSVDAIRKEVERCEAFSGLILMHSLSGGTGSGLGSRLAEVLKDEFSVQYLTSCVVAPHASGESSLQHYNSLLCLSWLNRFCDATVLLRNDDVLQHLDKPKSNPLEGGVTFDQMNKYIASCLAGVFLPTDSLTQKGSSIGQEPWEMLRSVSPMPSWKFLSVDSVHRSKSSWENLAVALGRSHPRYNCDGNAYQTISALAVARGSKGPFLSQDIQKINDKLTSAYNPVDWNPFPVDIWTATKNSVPSPNSASSLSSAVNSTRIVDFVEHVWMKAYEKYKAKAFLHWYWKYGLEEADFDAAFDSTKTIVEEYLSAVR